MVRLPTIALVLAAIAFTVPATPSSAAPAKKTETKRGKAPTKAVVGPELAPEPVMTRSADGMMTPNPVRLRLATPAEIEANAVWNVRAALNMAALGCQEWPFLATVRNWNDALRQHSAEFDRAKNTMVAHFRRYDGARAQASFDRYVTQTYNSFSTMDAQIGFCDRAGMLGREVLTIRKDQLGSAAPRLRDAARAALTPVAARSLLTPFEVDPQPLPTF